MGDNADNILDGFSCESCGCYIDGKAPGYPRLCNNCESDDCDCDTEWYDNDDYIAFEDEE